MDCTTKTTAESNGTLFPAHLEELTRGSGLTEETIRDAGIYSESDYLRLATLLNRKKYPKAWGGCLVFPYRDRAGTLVMNRVKPCNPPKRNGKPAKYLSPSGGGVRAYFPPAVVPLLDDPKKWLWITEGEKKALCATQHSFHCIGLSGVDCWHAKRSSTLIPDLHGIEWRDRPVLICFDSDAATNKNVVANERLLAAALKLQGAKVNIVRLPGDDGQKVGLDDYLVAKGPDALHELALHAEEPEPPDAGEELGQCKDADPGIEASRIFKECQRDSANHLIYWRGSFWWWSRGSYHEKPDDEMRATVVANLRRRLLGIRTRHVLDIFEHLRSLAILESTREAPCWLAGKPAGFDPVECLATRNEIIHLPSLANGVEGATVPATPNYLCTNACDFNLDPDAPTPQGWHDFLGQLWPDDQQSIDTLQELFGYSLTPNTAQQKIFMLVGPKRSGKGTIARVLTGLVGNENVVAPTLAGLSGPFGLQPLLGKSVALISDARLSGRTDHVAVVERLLSISGEDGITVPRKFLPDITCRLPTRFIILTNEMPRLSDASGAIVSRMILLQMTESFYGREDVKLTDKLLLERQGILLWSIEGWKRQHDRGRFVQPDVGLEALNEIADIASPVSAFVRDCCEVGPGKTISVQDLFEMWKSWCETQGREKYHGSVQMFGRDLVAAFPSIRRRQPRMGGHQVRVYEGIGRPGDDF